MRLLCRHLIAPCLLWAGVGAVAQVAVSVSDHRTAPDTVALIDMQTLPPRLLDEIELPAGGGLPPSVAVAPDESIALVASGRLSVIDLKRRPPRLAAVPSVGAAPAGVAINRAGTLALVANHGDCTVSAFTISGTALTPAGTVTLGGAPDCGARQVAISPDGRSALVTRDRDQKILVLAIDGAAVTSTGQDLSLGQRPQGIDFCVPGSIAVVASLGDAGRLSVVDMRSKPPRIIETLPLGQAPAELKCSPDGSYVAVMLMNGSASPGRLVLYMVVGATLQKFGELPIGSGSRGLAFAADGLTVLVRSAAPPSLQVFRIDGMRLVDTGQRIALRRAEQPR